MPSPSSKTEYSYKYRGWKFPTLLFATTSHETIAEAYEIDSILLSEGSLISALNAPAESAGNEDAYQYFFEKVAALGYRVIANHPFQDGNKRLGLWLITSTLEWNGHYLQWQEETEVFIIKFGRGRLSEAGRPETCPGTRLWIKSSFPHPLALTPKSPPWPALGPGRSFGQLLMLALVLEFTDFAASIWGAWVGARSAADRSMPFSSASNASLTLL
jgi:death-on-curing family protein